MNRIESPKQPDSLYINIFSYMCERFGFYILRTLLVMYMMQHLLLSTESAYRTFATFSVLLFAAPLLGGKFIDRNLYHDQALLIGGLLMSAGLFCIAFFNAGFINFALSLIICGNGLYEPAIIVATGEDYRPRDSRRERGYLSMYTAVSISAIAATLSAPIILWYTSWTNVFYIAAALTLTGTLVVYFTRFLNGSFNKISSQQLLEIFVLLVPGIVVFTLLMHSTSMSITFIAIVSSLLFIYTFASIDSINAMQRTPFYMCLGLTAFAVICFILTQESSMSLMTFAENNVARVFKGRDVPVFYLTALNPIFMIALAPLLSMFWRGGDSSSYARKFALGTLFLGAGFLILALGTESAQAHQSMLQLSWIVSSIFFQTLGELFIYPIGLAMITELAPRQMTGFMVGTWYFLIGIASWLSGAMEHYSVLLKHPAAHQHSSVAVTAYTNIFGSFGLAALISGSLLLVLASIFRKRGSLI